jgi:hypothetical protein
MSPDGPDRSAGPTATTSRSNGGEGSGKDDKDKPAGDASEVRKADRDDEKHGTDVIVEDAVDNAASFAAESQTLDAASAALGLQTNQQINFLGVGQAEKPYQTTPLSAETLARVRRAFVHSGDYVPLRDRVLDTHLVILSGRPGSGRQHLATHILDALCDGHVDHVAGGTMADLDVTDLAEDRGYLWIGIAGNPVGDIELSHADRLVEALRERDARMVIVWPDGTRFPFELENFRFPLTHDLDLGDVLQAHLDAEAESNPTAIATLLAHPDVTDARARLSGAGEATRLAHALKNVLLGRGSVPEALWQAEGTADWFARLPEREDRAFALSLAALDGLSYPAVVAGARRLDELVQAAEDPKQRFTIRPLHRPTPTLLGAVDAITKPGRAVTPYGDVPILAVSSNRKGFAREMLRTLWHDFPYLQELYLGWLAGLVEESDPNVRDRAAVVTGILALDDFEFVRSRVLFDWAGSDRREFRRAAGIALRAPALSVELADIVWEMLDDWAAADGPTDSPRYFRRMTAAVALGGPVGAINYGRALEIITTRLLDWKPGQYRYRLWGMTMVAVVDLFGDGGSAQSTAVLDRMAEWVDDQAVGPRTVAIAALVGIIARPPIVGYQDNRPLPPALRAVAADPKNTDRLATLWRLALNDRVMAKPSIAAMRKLAEHAGASVADELLFDLVQAFPETDRERRTLRYEVRQWTQEEPHHRILDRLLDLLEAREVTR